MQEFRLNLPTGVNVDISYSPNSTVRTVCEDISHKIKEPQNNVKISLPHRLRFISSNAPLKSLGINSHGMIKVTCEPRHLSFQYKNTAPIQIPFSVNSTITNAKLVLAPHFHVPPNNIRLSYENKYFDDSYLMKNIQIPYARHINIEIIETPVQHKIYLFMMQHEAYKIELDSEATIENAKDILLKHADENTASLVFRYNGVFIDESTKLSKLNIDDEDCIMVETATMTKNEYANYRRTKTSQNRRRKQNIGGNEPFNETNTTDIKTNEPV